MERSPNKYIQKYILQTGGDDSTPAMDFGKKFADVLEGKETDDEIVKLTKATIPKYAMPEAAMRVLLKTGNGREVPLLGKFDSYDPVTHDFLEYKTGKWKWTQQRAEKHGQLLFYKLMIYIANGIIPNSELIWLETENGDWGNIVLTGRIERFKVAHSMTDILRMMNRITRAAEEIETLYLRDIKNTFN